MSYGRRKGEEGERVEVMMTEDAKQGMRFSLLHVLPKIHMALIP